MGGREGGADNCGTRKVRMCRNRKRGEERERREMRGGEGEERGRREMRGGEG